MKQIIKLYEIAYALFSSQMSPVSSIAFANKAPHSHYLAIAESAARVMVWDVKNNSQKKAYNVSFFFS